MLTIPAVLEADAALDLQLHTTNSDGLWTPEQLIDHLVAEGFSLAAITDHDRTDTVAAVQALAAQKQFPLLAAAEMSTKWNGKPTDVLCYGFDPQKNDLNDLGQALARRQGDNTREVYQNLRNKAYLMTENPAELQAILEKPSAQHPRELLALLNKYGADEKAAWKMLKEAGYVFETNELGSVVEAAHRSGAVCLLAHPGRGGDFPTFDTAVLDQLRQDVPIDGLEVYYPVHTPEQITLFLEYAHKHSLLISSGSDSHSPAKQPIKYQAELSRTLLERLSIQVKH